jgi:hypothetical protein
VGRQQGVLTTSVVFSTVHEVGREQGVLTISVAFSTVHEVRRKGKEIYFLFLKTMADIIQINIQHFQLILAQN